MLCPGISQKTKHHHLTLYKGQVWKEKPHIELCNHNVLNIAYDSYANWESYGRWPIEKNGELHVPPVPGYGYTSGHTQIAYDSEILQSFAELTNITNITFHYFDSYEDSLDKFTYQIQVGNIMCDVEHNEQCVLPHTYFAWYIWTKEGLKIQLKYTGLEPWTRCAVLDNKIIN